MTRDHLKLLDMDEHLREMHTNLHRELLEFCRRYDLILDLATSDVVVYIIDKTGASIVIG